jgi:electron transfer flavoprotein alpha subunit
VNALAFSDNPDILLELIAGARSAAGDDGKVHAVTLEKDGQKAIAHGADVVHTLEAGDQHPWTLANAITQLAETAQAQAVIIGATKRGRAFAGLVAQKLDAAYAAEVSEISFKDGTPVARRMLLSGNTNGTIEYRKEKIVATANPKTWEPLEADDSRTGETQAASAQGSDRVELVKVHKHEAEGINLAQAKVVIGAGRGVKKQEDLKMLEDLAEAMGGALGCSRPLAADLKWLGEEHWIGLSGNVIRPRLYIACGVSGQIQHLTGCRSSKTIVAINSDEDAPIFENADYGIVADLYEVVPKLTELIQNAK